MNVLIACEFSGVVRRAFQARGHFAMSCDLLPAEDGSQNHFQGDAVEAAYGNGRWDLMIAHPPCTFLTNSGVRWLYKDGKQENGRDEQRWQDMAAAARFFKLMRDAPIPRICVENPIMHGYGRELVEADPAQIIQPWQFGHGETKATGLWLKNLPSLIPTDIVEGRQPRVHHAPPGPDRWKERSRTLAGIAEAMAEQWGSLSLAQDRHNRGNRCSEGPFQSMASKSL